MNPPRRASPSASPVRAAGMPRGLDFIARAPWGAWAWALVLLAALLTLSATVVAVRWWGQERELAALTEQLAQRTQPRGGVARAAPPDPVVEGDALQSAAELGVRWGPLLAHLARCGRRDVVLTQLEPDARAGALQIAGNAGSPEAALAYARRLGDGKVLADVQLLSHETLDRAAQLPVQFRLSARWQRQEP
jgi:hypothetical protein